MAWLLKRIFVTLQLFCLALGLAGLRASTRMQRWFDGRESAVPFLFGTACAGPRRRQRPWKALGAGIAAKVV